MTQFSFCSEQHTGEAKTTVQHQKINRTGNWPSSSHWWLILTLDRCFTWTFMIPSPSPPKAKHSVWDISVHKYLLTACRVPGVLHSTGVSRQEHLPSGVYILKGRGTEKPRQLQGRMSKTKIKRVPGSRLSWNGHGRALPCPMLFNN